MTNHQRKNTALIQSCLSLSLLSLTLGSRPLWRAKSISVKSDQTAKKQPARRAEAVEKSSYRGVAS